MRLRLACYVLMIAAACTSSSKKPGKPTCGNGIDPSSPECNLPQCMNGIDDDGDGFTDYPNDPGCFSPNQDSETDDCPNGPNCPECGNGKDDDGNGLTDFPQDPGCTAASDTDEYTENAYACGNNVHIQHLPFTNMVAGMYSQNSSNALQGSCGGVGIEDVYFLRLKQPKVVVASTAGSSTDTVMYLRSAACTDSTMELACNDNISASDVGSQITAALNPGTYYLVVDSNNGSVSNTYTLTVKFFVGEGTACTTGDDCGPGLLCKIPTGGSTKVCAKQNCRNGLDDDGDGKIDYPNDPGCTDPMDDDETDDCPSGPMCPECSNGRDDDADGKTDYPMDPQCIAASSTSEECPSHESVKEVTTGATMGDTTGATSDFETCGYQTGVPDLTYRLDVPALDSLTINADTGSTWTPAIELLGASCGGTALQCQTFSPIAVTNLAAGKYFVVVDGDGSTDYGAFTLDVSGTIKAGASCESQLAQSGALACPTGYACKGTPGMRTCAPAQCNNGLDDDGDGKIDYPNDPGCDSPGDDDETNGATPPVCADTMDNDGDGQTDWPNDFGCVAASGTSEVFCTGEMDVIGKVTTKTSTGTTAGKSNDSMPMTCGTNSAAPEVSYALQLPVPVASLQVDTLGTSFDTVLTWKDANCAAELACNDDDSADGVLQSKLTLSNVHAGGYAITIDGYSSYSGAYTLNVRGTVAAGTACTSPLFSGGANAVLVCPSGTTCTSGKCQ